MLLRVHSRLHSRPESYIVHRAQACPPLWTRLLWGHWVLRLHRMLILILILRKQCSSVQRACQQVTKNTPYQSINTHPGARTRKKVCRMRHWELRLLLCMGWCGQWSCCTHFQKCQQWLQHTPKGWSVRQLWLSRLPPRACDAVDRSGRFRLSKCWKHQGQKRRYDIKSFRTATAALWNHQRAIGQSPRAQWHRELPRSTQRHAPADWKLSQGSPTVENLLAMFEVLSLTSSHIQMRRCHSTVFRTRFAFHFGWLLSTLFHFWLLCLRIRSRLLNCHFLLRYYSCYWRAFASYFHHKDFL